MSKECFETKRCLENWVCIFFSARTCKKKKSLDIRFLMLISDPSFFSHNLVFLLRNKHLKIRPLPSFLAAIFKKYIDVNILAHFFFYSQYILTLFFTAIIINFLYLAARDEVLDIIGCEKRSVSKIFTSRHLYEMALKKEGKAITCKCLFIFE